METVRVGYNKAGVNHQKYIDLTRTEMSIYHLFKTKIKENVLELGFGNGRPIAEDLINSGFDYLGIDLSTTQVNLAQSLHPKSRQRFKEAEMLEFCKTSAPSSFGGVVAMFSIFHLPRVRHLELLVEIQRILKPDAPFLFTCHLSNWEGTEDDWLGADQMYWSNFPVDWYLKTLDSLGMTFVSMYRNVTTFIDHEETQYFVLYTK